MYIYIGIQQTSNLTSQLLHTRLELGMDNINTFKTKHNSNNNNNKTMELFAKNSKRLLIVYYFTILKLHG